MKNYINILLQYIFGFSVLGGKKLFGYSKKTFNAAYKQITVLLPFLSQNELLSWSKNLTNGVESIYDKAMDAEYIKTHIGGGYHRMFDGGHSPVNAWEKVINASETDSFAQEVIGYVSAMTKDATTKMGMPFTTIDKEYFDKTAEMLNATYGIKKSWLNDLLSWDVFEIFSTALGIVGSMFFLKKNDMKKVSEILGSMGIIAILSANSLMGITVIVQTVWAYVVKKKKLENKAALRGAGLSVITWSIFTILGLPILVELIIALAVLKLIKKAPLPGKSVVKLIFKRIQRLNKRSNETGKLMLTK